VMMKSALIKNILVIRTDRIGDVILTTPAIRALRRAFPDARMSLLVSPLTLDLVQGNSDIDEVLLDERYGRHAGWLGFWRLVKDIRGRHFDTAVNFHTKKRTNLLCFLAAIPRRIGYHNNKFGFLLTERVADVRPQGLKHESVYCLDVLKPLGVSAGDAEVLIPVQPQAEEWAERFFQNFDVPDSNLKFVALHIGASCPTKQWPVEYFARLVELMDSRRKTFFITIGTRDQREMVMKLRAMTGAKRSVYDLTGEISLAQCVSLLKRCDLLVSNDSGPVHIAAAFHRPVVSIFTRNQPGINPERWRPLGERSLHVAPPVDRTLSFAKGELEDTDFLYSITPEQVLAAVDAVFQV